MGTHTLVVDGRNAHLELGQNSTLIYNSDSGRERFGINTLQSVLVHGRSMLDSSLLRRLVESGVSVLLLPGRGSGLPADIFPSNSNQCRLRQLQYACHRDKHGKLSMARYFVGQKCLAQHQWLRLSGIHYPIDAILDNIDTASSIDSLLGIEGAAAARYFCLWRETLRPPWQFASRNRRPPLDPVNALLSLCYTLALHYIGRVSSIHGMDTALGFLHVPMSGRPAMVLDLLEPLRPVMDHYVQEILNNAVLQPEHFTISPIEGCRLTKEGRTIFYAHWYANESVWLTSASRDTLAGCFSHLRSTANTLEIETHA